MKKSRLFAIVDIKTTGSKPSYDKIVEINILISDGKQIHNTFHSHLNPERSLSHFESQLTGISNETLANAPKFYEVAKKIVQITENCVFVAYNLHFCYSFIKSEFRQLGYNYQRRTLCLLRLSKQLFPNIVSYTLKSICKHLGIEPPEAKQGSHVIYIIAQLFMHLNHSQNNFLESQIHLPTLPPQLNYTQILNLPEATGVYYFHDRDGNIIYIGKSRNIRKRVGSHLKIFSKNLRQSSLKESIAGISYQITGSELVALLLESAEIKKYKPRFNRAQRREKYFYGIYACKDTRGYLRFYIGKVKSDKKPILFVRHKFSGHRIIEKYQKLYNLCQKLCDMYPHAGACFDYYTGTCAGACVGKEPPNSYNERAKQVINQLTEFPKPNFCIIGKGRKITEKSLVWVEEGLYIGFGFCEIDFLSKHTVCSWKKFIQTQNATQDTHRIIQQYLKNTTDEIVYF